MASGPPEVLVKFALFAAPGSQSLGHDSFHAHIIGKHPEKLKLCEAERLLIMPERK
jgi:hypothetical protein